MPDGNGQPNRPLRVTVIGIDGSGKSSIARALRKRTPGGRWVTLHMINPHDVPDAPFHDLSRGLAALSRAADELRSYELKLAALYLQLCTYAPVERFLVDAYDPDVVFSDRHPLIDPLVYLPLYCRAARGMRVREVPGAAELRASLDRRRPGAYQAVLDWTEVQSRRLGHPTDPWRLGRELVEMQLHSPARMLAESTRRFRATLPDVMVLLDVSVDVALKRSAGRYRAGELHETRALLERARAGYEEVLARLRSLMPGVAVHRVANSGGSADEAADRIVELLAPVRCVA